MYYIQIFVSYIFLLPVSRVPSGRPTEFRYPMKIAWGINDFSQLSNVVDYGWGMAEDDKAFVFVDNHDTQRGQCAEHDY